MAAKGKRFRPVDVGRDGRAEAVLPGIDTVTVQDDMHRHRILSLNEAAPPETVEAFLSPPPKLSFDAMLRDIQDRINAELAAAGLPPGNQYVHWSGRNWSLLPPTDGRIRVALGSHFIRQHVDALSREWFLARISDAVLELEHLTGDDRLSAACALGHLLATLEHRTFYQSVHKAKNIRRHASAGGQARSAALRPRNILILEEMKRLIAKDHSIQRAAELCARGGIGKTGPANVRLWNRHMQKTRTVPATVLRTSGTSSANDTPGAATDGPNPPGQS